MAFDEAGPGHRSRSTRCAICQRAYQAADRGSRLSGRATSSSTPTSSPSATGIEEHNNYAVNFIEATRQIKAALPGRQSLRRREQRFVLVPRQRRGPRGDALGVSCTTPFTPAWTWASSTPASWPSTRRFRTDLLELVEDVLLNRRPDATERLVEFAETVKKQAGGAEIAAVGLAQRHRSKSG